MFVSETAVIKADVVAFELAPIKSYANLLSYGLMSNFAFALFSDENFQTKYTINIGVQRYLVLFK